MAGRGRPGHGGAPAGPADPGAVQRHPAAGGAGRRRQPGAAQPGQGGGLSRAGAALLSAASPLRPRAAADLDLAAAAQPGPSAPGSRAGPAGGDHHLRRLGQPRVLRRGVQRPGPRPAPFADRRRARRGGAVSADQPGPAACAAAAAPGPRQHPRSRCSPRPARPPRRPADHRRGPGGAAGTDQHRGDGSAAHPLRPRPRWPAARCDRRRESGRHPRARPADHHRQRRPAGAGGLLRAAAGHGGLSLRGAAAGGRGGPAAAAPA